MRLAVRTKLGLYVALILVLGASVGGYLYVLTRSIDGRVREVTEVDEPTSAAAFEMETNLIGTGFAVLGYLHDRDPLHLERIRDDEGDFEASQQQYLRLADFPGSGELAARIQTGYEQFRLTADELITLEDEQTAKMDLLLENFDRLDEILDEQRQASAVAGTADDSMKLHAAHEMEINTNGIAKGLGNFLRTHHQRYEARIQKDEQDFNEFLAVYRKTQLLPQERVWASKIGTLFDETVDLSREIIALDKTKEERLREFVQIRRELDVILDDEIQVLTTRDLAEAGDAVHASVSQIGTVIVVGVIGAVGVAILAVLAIARSITGPVGRLAEATQAVGRGDLSRRVEIESRDEFGMLGESFNRMVADLERSTGELETLNRELDQRVAQRTAESTSAEERALRALEELKLTQDNLVQAEKMSAVGGLVAGVAHELNNPLTVVVGFSELLLERDLDPGAQQSAQWISDEARRAALIVQNLLAFARKQEVRSAPVDVNQALTATLDLKGYDLRVSNIEVEMELAPDLPPIMADVNQLQSVFLNLISNAQYSITAAHDRGTLRVKTELLDGEVGVAIADDGSGIAAEDLRKVFDPFFTTKPVGTGTGLGLSICHGIVAEHGGRIWVESDYLRGATFHTAFPVAPSQPEGEDIRQPQPEELASVPVGGRVLVIDDEEAIRDLVTAALSKAGHQVDGLHDAGAALDLLGRASFDIVLVDIKMPGMNGPEFYRELAQRAPDMISRVVFMTGDTVSERTREFLERSERPVVEKPFDIETLQRTVAQVLATRSRTEPGAAVASG